MEASPRATATGDDAHLARAHEELRQHATSLVQAWEKLNQSRWSPAHGRGLQLAAKQLVRACERLRLSLSRKAGELETFVRVFVDTALTPDQEQLRTLSALVSTLASTALALDMVRARAGEASSTAAVAAPSSTHSPGPVPAAPPARAPSPVPTSRRAVATDMIVLIGDQAEFGVDLAAAFAEQGLGVRSFVRPEQALGLLCSAVPRAVVIGATCANSVQSLRAALAARAELGEQHAQPALAIVAPRQDLGRRLVALRQGVKYFESPLDPLAMLVALSSEAPAMQATSRTLLVTAERERGLESAGWLKEAGHSVRYCQSAAEGLDAIDSFRPHLAVIDADLRGGESMQLVHGLRDHPLTGDIPIVMVASGRELAQREQAIAGGADEYLLKPLKARHLISVAEARLKRSKRFAPRRAAARDESTGLYPRREFIERADAARGQPGAVILYIALDEHETLRKSLGISGQSRLDVAVGQALKEHLRAEDLPALYQDCRYLVLLRRSDRSAALAAAETLRESLQRRRILVAERELSLTASLGLAHLEGESADIAVQNAEAAALAALHLGGDRCMWFEAASATLVPAERDAQLRAILQSRRFGQHMEIRGAPLLPLRGRVPGQYELVLDWRPGGSGQPAAGQEDMVRVARDLGCAGELDRFVIGEALSVRADLLKRGRQVRLVVDLSQWALDDGSLAAHLASVLQERRQSGSGIALTLPAAVLGDRMEALVAFAQQLKPLAVRVGLKDIGRDLSLVQRLRGVPVDFLRLSPELSTGSGSSERATEWLAALIRRAHQTGLIVIASCIDNRDQAQQLQASGVDYAQSPTLGAPGPQFDFDFARWMLELASAAGG